jgi:glutamate--cysteine ligase
MPLNDGINSHQDKVLKWHLDFFNQPDVIPLLSRIKHGIEKEGLRTDLYGNLALTPHPKLFGEPLTNQWLTTDFSESLLEFITPVSESIDESLDYLFDCHTLAYQILKNEIIWPNSMPSRLPSDAQIPIAKYGNSNIAKMKTVYRRGLALRYGRAMQTIAGIHYNFSLPETLWRKLFEKSKYFGQTKIKLLQDYIDKRYFDLIRNFRRNYWLLIYLFGASPCVDKSFIQDRLNDLEKLNDKDLYKANATSLRMGDLGYQSKVQQSLSISYNSLEDYISSLSNALKKSYEPYEKFQKKENGLYQQLSSSILQIENEFYSPIRPKQVIRLGETPLNALRYRGVEYIEIRCLDLNPFNPIGIDKKTIKFLDAFLLYCLCDNSEMSNDYETEIISKNQSEIVNHGRKRDLLIQTSSGTQSIKEKSIEIFDKLEMIAKQLDKTHGSNDYLDSIKEQKLKIKYSKLTASSKLLIQMEKENLSFIDLNLKLAEQHANLFKHHKVDKFKHQNLLNLIKQSIRIHKDFEQKNEINFDQYLFEYFKEKK